MADAYRILFLGDVVGKPGREAVVAELPGLRSTHEPMFVIVNGENAAGGVGITPAIAEELFEAGADAITLGNHAFNKREAFDYLNSGRPIVRPANLPPGAPGVGSAVLEKAGVRLFVANLCGRVFMESVYDDPFRVVDELLARADTPHRLIDFHAEATSEKIAMAYHLAGRAAAVLGTHTHVQTADERILEGGTAAITDVGMCGPPDSVLGMDKVAILRKFRTGVPVRFEVAPGPGVICGAVIDVQIDTGRAFAIRRVRSNV